MFVTWSIADVWGGIAGAWNWFVHVPVLGFLCVAVVAVLVVAAVLEIQVWNEHRPRR